MARTGRRRISETMRNVLRLTRVARIGNPIRAGEIVGFTPGKLRDRIIQLGTRIENVVVAKAL